MATIPLIGPSYQSQSVAADCQRTINWYPEAIESGQGKAPLVLYPTPGLRPFLSNPGTTVGSWRGLYVAPPQVFGVIGATFVELTRDPSGLMQVVPHGTVGNDGFNVQMADNGAAGHQVAIASNGVLSLYDVWTTALTTPTLAFTDPVIGVAFLDGYFLALSPSKLQISNLFDGSGTWPATQVAQRSEGPDPFKALMRIHRELWLFGVITTEVWYDSGNNDFPFAPIPGVFLDYGCSAARSVARLDQSVVWLAQNREGARLAVQAAQYAPQRVSTHAIETEWNSYPQVNDAVSWTYQDAGHMFWVLTFPQAGHTWVYDAATQLWHERMFWNPNTGLAEAHRGSCHTWVAGAGPNFGQHLVGDRATGMLYNLDPTQYVDDCPDAPRAAIRRIRRTPHLSQENQLLRYQRLELEMEMGLGLATGQGTHPQAMLRWSDDRAHTWSPEWWVDASPMGTYAARAQWWRLGRARDRVFELSVSDPIPWRLTGAYLTAAPGTS